MLLLCIFKKKKKPDQTNELGYLSVCVGRKTEI